MMKNLQRDGRGETIAKARSCYERSLVADPSCAPAFLGLANTYLAAWIEPTEYSPIAKEYRQPATLDRAQAEAQQAIERDSDLAEAHAMLGYVLHQQHRRAESLRQYQRAFALNPNLADDDTAWCHALREGPPKASSFSNE